MVRTVFASACAAVALVAMSASVDATPIEIHSLTYNGQTHGKRNVYTSDTSTTPNGNRSGSAGPFNMTNNTDSSFNTDNGSFLAWCLDLYDRLATGTSNYKKLVGPFDGPGIGPNPNPFNGANGNGKRAPVLSNDQLANIENLFQTNSMAVEGIYDKSISGLNSKAAGFQLAIWELIYETDAGPFNLTTGKFQRRTSTASSVVTAANTFLGNLANKPDVTYAFTYWENTLGNKQNLISIKQNPDGSPSPVPLPAAAFLLIGALAGLGAVSRTRKA